MDFIFILGLIYLFKKMKPDRRRSDSTKIFGGLFAAIFLLSILSELAPLFPIAVIIALVIYFSKQGKIPKMQEFEKAAKDIFGAGSDTKASSGAGGTTRASSKYEYADRAEHLNTVRENAANRGNASAGTTGGMHGGIQGSPKGTTPRKVTSYILPRPATKRKKILKKFNEKYTLYLTEEEMQKIVDASYFSNAWKRELEAMSEKYDTVYEWMSGDTAYLRAYLYVFHVQTISADYELQDQVCREAFDEIFSYITQYEDLTVQEKILRVNEKFFTSFDDVTFMIAYRYMIARGYKYELGKTTTRQNVEADFEDLIKKYDEQEKQEEKGQQTV